MAAFELSQYQLLGGVVVLRSRPGEVEVVSAVPNSGYEVSIDQKSPASVEVEFEAVDPDNRYEGELHAEWRDGDLVVEIEEDPSDGGDES